MPNKREELVEKFNLLPIRSRLLITFAGIMLIYLLIDLFWYSSNASRQKSLQMQITQTEKQITEYTNSQNEINAGIYNQRNNPKRLTLNSLNEQIESTHNQLEQRAVNLVKPEDMAMLVKQIINKSQQLKLISFEKQAPQALFEQKTKTTSKAAAVQMYRHPIRLTFSGSFFDTQKFLSELENMPQKVNFEKIEYMVENYPTSKVTLVLSTLSLSRKWIGG